MQRKGDSIATFFILFLIIIISFGGGMIFERYVFSEIKETELHCKDKELSTLKEDDSIYPIMPLNRVKIINSYNNSRKNATQVSILTSTTSSTDDLKNLGFCNSATTSAHVSYTPVTDQYTLTCTNGATQTEVATVRGIINISSCNGTAATCTYKVNR